MSVCVLEDKHGYQITESDKGLIRYAEDGEEEARVIRYAEDGEEEARVIDKGLEGIVCYDLKFQPFLWFK
jgi:hypothetical protein